MKGGRSEKDHSLWRDYKISLEDYEAVYALQGGACALCRTTAPMHGEGCLFVDHDHLTGLPRGLLCLYCNTVVGFMESGGWPGVSPETVEAYVTHALKGGYVAPVSRPREIAPPNGGV